MTYEQWRDDVFGQPDGSDPVMTELSQETYATPNDIALNYIDRALVDDSIHERFSVDQIAFGLMTIYNNSCSNLPFCYVEGADEHRRIEAIENLRHLYSNFFARYCTEPVHELGDGGSPLAHLCYMLWDVFVLYPGNATPGMISASLDIMRRSIHMANEACMISGFHGLGHWIPEAPVAKRIVTDWLRQPATRNEVILDYARQAETGCVL
jgi:hypothetical protein